MLIASIISPAKLALLVATPTDDLSSLCDAQTMNLTTCDLGHSATDLNRHLHELAEVSFDAAGASSVVAEHHDIVGFLKSNGLLELVDCLRIASADISTIALVADVADFFVEFDTGSPLWRLMPKGYLHLHALNAFIEI